MPKIAENIKDDFIDQIDRKLAKDEAHSDSILAKLRTHALSSFKNTEFPTRKSEDWKYTSVRDILNQEYTAQPQKEFAAEIPKHFDAFTLRFVNGTLVSSDTNSLPNGVFVGKLSELSSNTSAYKQLLQLSDQVLNTELDVFVTSRPVVVRLQFLAQFIHIHAYR